MSNRKCVTLVADKLTRPQEPRPDLHYVFAPLKQARQDYMLEKAVEMGAGVLRPVLTGRTQTSRINSDRMHAHAIEAAEQCGILSIPEIASPIRLDAMLGAWDENRLLVFCGRRAIRRSVGGAAFPRRSKRATSARRFDRPRRRLRAPGKGGAPWLVLRVAPAFRPRILRADTAAIAALALVQAALGDWRE